MKDARISVVIILCCAAVGLTGCCSSCREGAEAAAKLDQIAWKGQDDFHWPEGKRAAISLSFDDARLSQVDRGLPILDASGVKATFYVMAQQVERRLSSWKKAVANGHEIGNHTLKHPCTGNFGARENGLEGYNLEKMDRELGEASDAIEGLLGVRPATFAYPCGQKFVGRALAVKSYVPLVARRFIVGRRAYDEVANDPAFCDLAQAMGLDLDGLDFEQARLQIDKAAAQGRWLIFFGHEVGEPEHQTVRASTLEAICQYAQDPANGLWIDTVEKVGEYILEQRAGDN